MIWNWNEWRIIKIMLLSILVVGGGYIGTGYLGDIRTVSFNSLSAAMKNNGLFPNSNFSE